MKQKRISKILALLCCVVLTISSVNLNAFATETTKDTKEATGGTLLGMEDFLEGATEKTWSYQSGLATAGEGTLAGVTIDGIFNITRYSSVSIGSQSGYRLMMGVNNSEYFYYQVANAGGLVTGGETKTFAPADLGCNYNGQDVRIKASFEFTNESGDTADVTIRLQIGDYLEEQVINISGAIMSQFGRNIYVSSNNGNVTLKAAPEDAQVVLGIDDFIGGEPQKSWSGSNSELITAGTGTLHNVTIDGIFNLSRYSSIAIGSQAGYRVMIGVHNDYSFYYQVANAQGIVAGGERKSFDANTLGCNYSSQDVRIKASFEFTRQNHLTGLADVTIRLQIGDYLEEQVLTFTGVIMSQLGRNIFVNPNTGAVTLKVAPEETHTVLGIDDFIAGEPQQSWTGSNSALITAGEGTLDNVTIDGIFNISRYSSVAIGSQSGYRLMLGVNNGSMFYYQVANASGLVTSQVTLDANAMGCYYNGQDVHVRVSFEFAKQNYVTGLADVTIKLQIGDYLDEITLNISGAVMSQFGRNIFVNPNTGAVTLKVAPEETTAFTVLSVKDFVGADENTYTDANKQLLTAGEGNLDRVVIDGTINLSRYSSILIGSQAQNRLQIGINNGYVLYYQYCNAQGVVNGISEYFDTTYASKDLKLNVSFVYSRKNTVANTADVTVRFNIGDSIQREFTVSGVSMSELQRAIYPNTNTGTISFKTNVDYRVAETGFAISGEGITVDGVSTTNTVLKTPGDYFVRSTEADLYAKYVVVYKVGDAHVDGALDACDLVATMKAASGEGLATKAAVKSADADANGTINDSDCEAIRGLLIQ